MPRVSAAERNDALGKRIARNQRERANERALAARWAASEPDGAYRAGFLAGYLRAFEDGDEYACSVEAAVLAFGRYLRDGGRKLPLRDIDGW